MTVFFKKLTVLPALLMLAMMPLVAFAQTTAMTEGVTTKRPLPVISDEIKATRIAQAEPTDESEDLSTEEELNSQEENMHYDLVSVDAQQVQEAWLSWINHERSTKGLQPLQLEKTLTTTSIEWASHLAKINKFTKMHQRPGQACTNARCYDVADWFAQRGVSTAAETVLFGGYSCTSNDCTQDFITTTKGRTGGPSGFLGFLMGEKRYNGVHYRMMMNPKYTSVGIGFAQARHPRFGGAYIGVLHFN